MSSLAFSRSSDTWSPALGVAGRLRVLGMVCLGQHVQGSRLNGIPRARGIETHPPTANVCEEDHTPLFSFVIHSLLAPHLMLESTLCYIQGSFSWHNHGFVSLFDVSHRKIVCKDSERKMGVIISKSSLLPALFISHPTEEV